MCINTVTSQVASYYMSYTKDTKDTKDIKVQTDQQIILLAKVTYVHATYGISQVMQCQVTQDHLDLL